MRAAVYRRYGGPSVVRVEEVDTPVPGAGRGARPGDGIRRQHHRCRDAFGHAVRRQAVRGAVPPATARARLGVHRHRRRRRRGRRRVRVGDAVWGITGTGMRAHAEYVVVPADGVLEPLPAGLDPVDAAALIDPTALSFLDDTAELVAGQTILINGASGAVGTVGGPARGAPRCDRHRGVQRRAGADRPRTRRARGARLPRRRRRHDASRAQGRTFDVVFDVFGNLGYRRARDLLTPTGRYCGTVPTLPDPVAHAPSRGRSPGRRGVIAFTGLRGTDAVHVRPARDGGARAGRRAAGRSSTPRYPLDRVADAHAHVERGKAGHIVLTMG